MQCPNCGSFGVDSDLDNALCRTCGYNWTPRIEPDWNGDLYPDESSTSDTGWEASRRPIVDKENGYPPEFPALLGQAPGFDPIVTEEGEELDEEDDDTGAEEDVDEDADWADEFDDWDEDDDWDAQRDVWDVEAEE